MGARRRATPLTACPRPLGCPGQVRLRLRRLLFVCDRCRHIYGVEDWRRLLMARTRPRPRRSHRPDLVQLGLPRDLVLTR